MFDSLATAETIDEQHFNIVERRNIMISKNIYPGFAPIHYAVIFGNAKLFQFLLPTCYHQTTREAVVINKLYMSQSTNILHLMIMLERTELIDMFL